IQEIYTVLSVETFCSNEEVIMRITKPLAALVFAISFTAPVAAESGGAEMSRDFRSGNCWYTDASQGKCTVNKHSESAVIYGSKSASVPEHTRAIVRDRK